MNSDNAIPADEGRRIAEAVSGARAPEPPWFFFEGSSTQGSAIVRGDGARVVLLDGGASWPKRPGRVLARGVFPRDAVPWDKRTHAYVRCEASARRDRVAAELVRKGGLLERYLPRWAESAKLAARNRADDERVTEALRLLGAEVPAWAARDGAGVVTLASGERFTAQVNPRDGSVRVRDLAVPVALLRRWLDVEREWHAGTGLS